jgi:predicted DNA-binding protein
MKKSKEFDKTIAIRLPSDVHKKFMTWCVNNDTKMAYFIRDCIEGVINGNAENSE